MKLQFDVNHHVEDFTFVLSSRAYDHYGEINNIKRDNVICRMNMNSANEITFEVYKTLDYEDERLWDEITDLKLVWVKELDEYFEINVSLDDSISPVKNIIATSLCEAELSQVNLYNIEINTQSDIAREDYKETEPTIFYNETNPQASLLHRILDKVPHYSIKHVDATLMNMQRTFSIDGTSIYDWLVGECSEQFNCLFLFDSTDRSISAYDLYSTCNACGYRGDFTDVCPECESDDITYYGEDTTIYIDKENLTESVKLETDIGSVKNCFKLEAGDDLMTATIRSVNPNGTDYIYYISEEQKADMSEELKEKIESYDALVLSKTTEYEEIMTEIYDVLDDIQFYQSGMMPTPDQAEVTAKTEVNKLTSGNLSPLALSKVTENTTQQMVENSLLNYARVYVKTGYVKLEIENGMYAYTGDNTGVWVGKLKVTNYSDEEDFATSNIITVEVNDKYKEFLEQQVLKSIADDDDGKEGSVFDVLKLEDIEELKEALTHYCLERLRSFTDAFEGALTILQRFNEGNDEESEMYQVLYDPYFARFTACQNEFNIRQAQIDELKAQEKELNKRKEEIQKELNFETYLGQELFAEFCAYRREDKYSNSNYISDGLDEDNPKLFDNARKFMEVAKAELYKSAMRQHSISTTIHNLLIMPEFQVIVDKFELGNWIRVGVDGQVYRLRLISYELNFSSLQTLNIEFSDLTKQVGCVSDLQSVISSAQSMSTNFSYVSKQAEKGETAQKTFSKMSEEGLDSSLVQIKNSTNSDVVIGKNGITCRNYDDSIDDYNPEQMKITNNCLVFTDSGWQKSKTALGKHDYYRFDKGGSTTYSLRRTNQLPSIERNKYTGYGLSSDFVIAGYINGSQIIGGEIFSTNYSPTIGSYMNLEDGTFSFAGGKLTSSKDDNDEYKLEVTGTIKSSVLDGNEIKGGTITIGDVFKADATKNEVEITCKLTAKEGGTIGGFDIGDKSIYKGTTSLDINNDTVKGVYVGTDGFLNYDSANSYTKITGGQIATNNIVATGGSIKIGDKFSVDAEGVEITGKLNAEEGGKIGGFDIGGKAIYNGTDALDSEDVGIYLGTDGFLNYASSRSYTKIADGQITTNNIIAKGGKIGDISIDARGLYYSSDTNTADGFGLWGGAAHPHNNSYIVMHAGGNNSKIASANFRLYRDGTLYASKANIEGNITGGSININDMFIVDEYGKITSKSGSIDLGNVKFDSDGNATIGGFTVDSDSFYNNGNSSWSSTNGTTPDVFMCTGTPQPYKIAGTELSGWCFGAGGKFGVTNTGAVYADDVYLTGNINATSGSIGNWTVIQNGEYAGCLEGKGGANVIRMFPQGCEYTATDGAKYPFYLVMYNSGGGIPNGGLTASGWKAIQT